MGSVRGTYKSEMLTINKSHSVSLSSTYFNTLRSETEPCTFFRRKRFIQINKQLVNSKTKSVWFYLEKGKTANRTSFEWFFLMTNWKPTNALRLLSSFLLLFVRISITFLDSYRYFPWIIYYNWKLTINFSFFSVSIFFDAIALQSESILFFFLFRKVALVYDARAIVH